MTYSVKETFLTLQGEGAHSGRPAVFCRFAGCNLWTGREADRATAKCQFCDTDFMGTDGDGGGKFTTAQALAEHIHAKWPATPDTRARPYVVFTGGEPLLQLDQALVDALHDRGFEVAIETNGTLLPPDGVDWICMSPKAGVELTLLRGNELKLVFPQDGVLPPSVEHLEFDEFYLQPMDGDHRERNTAMAVQYCLTHPRWRLSLQTHKILSIP